MSEIEYTDVRRKQIECLVNVLQSSGQQLTCDQWPTVIETVRVVVAGKLRLLFTTVLNLILQFYVYCRWALVCSAELLNSLHLSMLLKYAQNF